jgi:hypothetical protein
VSRQTQKGGDNATNIQSGGPITIVQHGLTAGDVTEIALAAVQSELERFTGSAREVFAERSREFIEDLLIPNLLSSNPDGLETFADPDMQYALNHGQLAYGRTGDKDVAEVLVDIIVDRTRQTERDILQLSLTESLQTAAKLTSNQFAILSLIWILRYTSNLGVKSPEELAKYFEEHISPILPISSTSNATFQHLEYAGCGTVGISSVTIQNLLSANYTGLFFKGFTAVEVAAHLPLAAPAISGLLMPCLNDHSKLQLNALNERLLLQRAEEIGIIEEDRIRLKQLFAQYRMNDDEIIESVSVLYTGFPALISAWNETAMCRMTLTSVGTVIAHANCRRLLGRTPGDLSIWIN